MLMQEWSAGKGAEMELYSVYGKEKKKTKLKLRVHEMYLETKGITL